MSNFKVKADASTRIHALEKERKKHQDSIERRRDNISTATSTATANATAIANFAAPSDTVGDMLTTDTVGLVTHNDFKARRLYLERCASREREKREALLQQTRNREALKRRKRANKAVLSFQNDSDESEENSDDADDADDDDDINDNGSASHSDDRNGNNAKLYSVVAKRRRLGKDPNVDTTFLPDRERESAERAERERLKEDWINKQEQIKNETIRITYSYWDGSGHRRVMRCKKGITVGRFLAMVQTEFKQLRNTSADELMFIKEDLIIPHHYSFYDFVVMKARGKSGPLFNFDVVEDVRVVDDPTREKEDAHAAKVCERRWYERNRHIFPASRWEIYDPAKSYDRYTIHGN